MKARSLRRTLSAALLAGALGVVGLPVAQAGGGQIVTHKFFPLKPGTVFHYKSTDNSSGATTKHTTVKVLNKTRVIDGHRSQEVETKEYEGGSLTEHFHDWYFQGAKGIVYYMKHTSKRSGESWEAGVGSARKGIYLPADPQVGDVWKRTRAPDAGREGRDQAKAYAVSSGTLKIKVSSYAHLYSETVKFYYTAGKGLTRILDKDETTRLTSITQP
jgi:hypothetical protein